MLIKFYLCETLIRTYSGIHLVIQRHAGRKPEKNSIVLREILEKNITNPIREGGGKVEGGAKELYDRYGIIWPLWRLAVVWVDKNVKVRSHGWRSTGLRCLCRPITIAVCNARRRRRRSIKYQCLLNIYITFYFKTTF